MHFGFFLCSLYTLLSLTGKVSHCAGLLQIKLREEIQDEEGQGEGLPSVFFFRDEV